MGEGKIDDFCGCLLGEFAKSKGIKDGFAWVKGRINNNVGYDDIRVDLGGKSIFNYFKSGGSAGETFGELKKNFIGLTPDKQ